MAPRADPFRRRVPAALLAMALLALALAGCGDDGGDGPRDATSIERDVPFGFIGTTADGPLLSPREVDVDAESKTMVRAGVEGVRIAVDWSLIQPFASRAELPRDYAPLFPDDVDGVPTSWVQTDALVRAAAERRIPVLPTVLRSPRWAALDKRDPHISAPAETGPYARFLTALVERYGPDGEFWRENPEVTAEPITAWQIWNEPDQPGRYWSQQPFAKRYVELLGAARDAIKAADPDATIVLAGLVGESWEHLETVYRIPGARELFDVVAIHPYTLEVRNVLKILDLVRGVMRRNGDAAKPLWVTELTWTSAAGKAEQFGYEVTPKVQAEKLAEAYPLLARERERLKLERVYWYTWLSTDKGSDDPFAYAGLRRFAGRGRVVPKPAFGAYERVARSLEGCTKGDVATECAD
jgi:hypothetical protein